MFIKVITLAEMPRIELPQDTTADQIDGIIRARYGPQLNGKPHDWLWEIPQTYQEPLMGGDENEHNIDL